VRLYRGEKLEFETDSKVMFKEKFPKLAYLDVAGLCKAATLAEIQAQGWSLNPGRYMGAGERAADKFDFAERLQQLNEELQALSIESAALESRIASSISAIVAS